MNIMSRIICSYVFCIVFFLCGMTVNAQNQQGTLQNRLPRKTIIHAAQRTIQDSIKNMGTPLICEPSTSSIVVRISSSNKKKESPRLITVDTLGITLEVFSGENRVYYESFEYKETNFAKILAKAKASKLKRTKEYKSPIDCKRDTTLSFNVSNKTYFEISNIDGVAVYAGDFKGFIKYITTQIPKFEEIINSEFLNPADFEDNMALINGIKVHKQPTTEIDGVLTVNTDSINAQFSKKQISKIIIQLEISPSEAQQQRLVKVNHYYGRKKKIKYSGFTYEDIVKNSILPSSVKVSYNGIAEIVFDGQNLDNGIYAIYNPIVNNIVYFEITNV